MGLFRRFLGPVVSFLSFRSLILLIPNFLPSPSPLSTLTPPTLLYSCRFLFVVHNECFFILLLISELEAERRALEESEREKRLLASRVDDLSGRLELAERERREVMTELDAATKRLDQSEGGKNALVDQVMYSYFGSKLQGNATIPKKSCCTC